MPAPAVNAITDDDVYNFDTAGFLHLRGVLSASEQDAAAAAVRAAGSDAAALGAIARSLLERPSLRTRVVQLVADVPEGGDVWGDKAYLAQGAPIDGKTGALTLQTGVASMLTGNDEESLVGGPGEGGALDFTRTYLYDAGHRYVHGLVVVWALASGSSCGGYACVPGTHKGTLEVPSNLREASGTAPLTNLGILQQPPLQAGDVLLISSATLHGARPPADGGDGPLLLRCEFLSHMARMDTVSERHDSAREPEWMQELSDVERAVMGLEPQHRAAGDGHPTVRASAAEAKAWLEDIPSNEPFHPAALVKNEALTAQQQEDIWLWETCGFLILRGVMDPAWVAAANATVDWALAEVRATTTFIATCNLNQNRAETHVSFPWAFAGQFEH